MKATTVIIITIVIAAMVCTAGCTSSSGSSSSKSATNDPSFVITSHTYENGYVIVTGHGTSSSSRHYVVGVDVTDRDGNLIRETSISMPASSSGTRVKGQVYVGTGKTVEISFVGVNEDYAKGRVYYQIDGVVKS